MGSIIYTLVTDHIQDGDKRFADMMEQLEGFDASFTTKLDAKF
jgi:hypothetical protein